MTFKLPSLLIVKGIDDDDNVCDWYAEAVGQVRINGIVHYEVYYLIPDSIDSRYMVYDVNYETVSVECVQYIQPVTHGDYATAWLSMGICFPCDNGKYLRVSDPVQDNEEEIDDNSSDIGSIDSYSTIESTDTNVSDLIDDTDTQYCKSDCTCTLCNDIVVCDRQFKDWIPSNERERLTKDFIMQLEDAVVKEHDNIIF